MVIPWSYDCEDVVTMAILEMHYYRTMYDHYTYHTKCLEIFRRGLNRGSNCMEYGSLMHQDAVALKKYLC